MADMTSTALPDGVFEHDGMLWKPGPETTTTVGEFIEAQTFFTELTDDAMWNPWMREERKADLDRAMEIMGQWHRAEPGHRMMTLKQVRAQIARDRRKWKQEYAKDQARRERDKARYDKERAEARLRLIEVQSILRHQEAELVGFRDGGKAPARDPQWRATRAEELEGEIVPLRAEIEQLTGVVGDPEDVVDEHGWLPRDRRLQTWMTYRLDRERNVRDLKKQVPELEAALKVATGRAERRERRDRLAKATRELEKLLDAGPFTEDDMCSECATPMAHHGWTWPPGTPCRAWPEWAARLRKAWQILETSTKRQVDDVPPTPKPQPLAVVPSGLPIAEIVAKLNELQKEFPNAQVRRGRANRWELWAPDD